MKIHCGILASGNGTRYSSVGAPKQLLPVGGSTLFAVTLKSVTKKCSFDTINIAVSPNLKERFFEEIEREFSESEQHKINIFLGGDSRIKSMLNLIDGIADRHAIGNEDIFVLIDANRPLVQASIYTNVVEAAKQFRVACPASELVDGVAFVKDGFIQDIPDKNTFNSIQTPEACNFRDLINFIELGAHEKHKGLSEIFLSQGIAAKLVKSDSSTFKVTNPGDMLIISALMEIYNEL